MKAMSFSTPARVETQPLNFVELDKPKPGEVEVLLRIQTCGVCHTDLHLVEGEIHPPHTPLVPGHQVVGVVDSLGEGADRYVSAGDRVGVPWLFSACGRCQFCQRGEENLCPYARFTGFDVNGGFAEWMVADARWVMPLPESISNLEAAPLLCAGIIGYRSLRRADLKTGETIGLVGFGASAHLAIQIASFWDCQTFVFTRSDRHRQHALELGAAWVGGIEDTPPSDLDRAVIFAPAGYLVPAVLEKLRPGGTLAVNAIYMSEIPAMPYSLIYLERTLRSVANATYQDGIDFLQIVQQAGIRVDYVTYPLEAANQALEDLKTSRINGEAVLVIK